MENLYYYFYDYRVETATTEIKLPGWQPLTSEEIIIYQNNDYDNIEFINNKYCFTKNNITINLDEYKNLKINEFSRLSFIIGEEIIPNYKYMNCLISKQFVERGEDPIYSNYIELMEQYEILRKDLRTEFYRCKEAVLKCNSIKEIDDIIFVYEKKS